MRTEPGMAQERSNGQTAAKYRMYRPPELDDPKYDTVRLPVRAIGGGSLFWRRKKDRFIELPVRRMWMRIAEPER